MTAGSLSLCVALVLLAVGCPGAQTPRPNEPTYGVAEAAFMRHDFDAAESAYERATAADTGEHRDRSIIALAAIRWRIRGDSAGAVARLGSRNGTARFPLLAALETSRMLVAMGHFPGAITAARAAVRLAADSVDRRRGRIALAAAVTESVLQSSASGRAADSTIEGMLPEVVALLSDEVAAVPGSPGLARLLVIAAALHRDGPALLRGWRSFYLTGVSDTNMAPLASPRRVLEAALPRWNAAAAMAHTDSVILALADSRLFGAAAAIARARTGSPNGRISEIVAYAATLRRVSQATDAYYLATALKKGSTRQWRAELDKAGEALWPLLDWKDAPSKYAFEKLSPELDRRFGALVNIGETAGYEDLHMGHRVVDERRTVSQYGRSATLRFISLDHMVSNGFRVGRGMAERRMAAGAPRS